MTCPVEIVDYQSSLVAADWYEEQGEIHYSQALKELPPSSMWLRCWYQQFPKRISRSRSRTGHLHSSGCNAVGREYSNLSWSGSGKFDDYHISTSRARHRWKV